MSDAPTPFTEDMPASALRGAYENYAATRKRIDRHLEAIRLDTGLLAEQAARIIQWGGEI